MGLLTDKEVMRMLSAGVLFGRCHHVLSQFEAETVYEAGKRFVEFKREAQVTDAEWLVIDEATEAMRKEVARLAALDEAA